MQQRIRLATGDDAQPRALIERFVEAGYERVAMVEGRGQVALRGGIVDVYATDARYPVRMEFWGDTIDQMRSFDPVTQRSIEQVTRAVFAPAFETPQTQAAVARADPCRRAAPARGGGAGRADCVRGERGRDARAR